MHNKLQILMHFLVSKLMLTKQIQCSTASETLIKQNLNIQENSPPVPNALPKMKVFFPQVLFKDINSQSLSVVLMTYLIQFIINQPMMELILYMKLLLKLNKYELKNYKNKISTNQEDYSFARLTSIKMLLNNCEKLIS